MSDITGERGMERRLPKFFRRIDPASARLIELRFLLGCTAEEVADMQGTSKATVDRNVRLAKMWLFRRLQPS